MVDRQLYLAAMPGINSTIVLADVTVLTRVARPNRPIARYRALKRAIGR